jgi:arylsulfatase A-like enzyme
MSLSLRSVFVAASAFFGTRALALAIALTPGVLAQAPESAAAKPAPGPNVLVISVDALRRDHMSSYGYARETTPRIDALLAESVVFESGFTPIARSLPAHVSLWTASWPHRHGVIAHGGARNVFATGPLRRSAAEMLRDQGFKTTSFVGTYLLGKAGGLNIGFEFVDEPAKADVGAREIVRTSSEIAERAARWLGFHKGAAFALWTHFEAPAEPNDPPAELLARFRGDGRSGALLDARGIDPARFQIGFPTLLAIRMFFPELEGTVTPTPELTLPKVDRSKFESVLDRYDADVRSVDDAVGVLLDRLKELKLDDSTLIVFVGAFGQSHGDRSVLGSGEVTLENTLVPMAIRFPKAAGVAPRRVGGLASLIDVLPTAFARTHPEVAAKLIAQGDGRDLLAEGAAREYVLSMRTRRENARNDPGPIFAWRSREWAYIYRPELTDYLFDLTDDPRELESVISKQPEMAAKLKARALEAFGFAK